MRSRSVRFPFVLLICAIGLSVGSSCGNSPSRMEGPEAVQTAGGNGENIFMNKVEGGNEKETDDNPLDLPVEVKLSGVQLKVLSIALDSFQTDSLIPENKRNIENYNVELRQSVNHYYAYFAARRTREDEREFREGGETTLGKSVMFVVNKKTMSIQRRYFFQ